MATGTGAQASYASGLVLSGHYSNEIVLSDPATQNPVTVTPTGNIDAFPGIGLLGQSGFAWTVSNYGQINGSVGIKLQSGGTVDNFGNITGGIVLGGDGAVVNGKPGVTTAGYGSILGDIRIAGSGSVLNYRDITGGIYIRGAGSLANYGNMAAGIYFGSGTVVNAGDVAAFIHVAGDGLVANYGDMGAGIYLGSGTVVNAGGVAADIRITGAGYVVNSGDMSAGIVLGSGTFLNSGSVLADVRVMGPGAVLNSGVFHGSVSLAGGSDRLVVQPGAVFQQLVDGGGGSSVLELDGAPSAEIAGDAVSSIGTLTGLGSQFTGFQSLMLDPNAQWALSGSTGRVVNDGTIFVANGYGLSLGAISAGGRVSAASDPAGGAGVPQPPNTAGNLNVASYGTVEFTASVAASQTVTFADGTGVVRIDQPKHFAGVISGFQAGDTIDVAHFRAAAYSYSYGVLQLTNAAGGQLQLQLSVYASGAYFQLAPAGAGGTDIMLAPGPAGERRETAGHAAFAISGEPVRSLLAAEYRPGALFAQLPGR